MFAVAADGDGACFSLTFWTVLTVPCLVYNTAMYTVYGRCGQYGRCMAHTLAGAAGVAGAAGAWFIRTLRKNTVESALDILKCSKKWRMSDNIEFLLLSPSIDSITKSQNRTVKDLLFEFLSGTKRTL